MVVLPSSDASAYFIASPILPIPGNFWDASLRPTTFVSGLVMAGGIWVILRLWHEPTASRLINSLNATEAPWGTKWVSPNVAYFQMEVVEKVRYVLWWYTRRNRDIWYGVLCFNWVLAGGTKSEKAQSRPPLRYVLFAVYIYICMYFIIYISVYIYIWLHMYIYT